MAKRERREAHRLAGVAMDGRRLVFVRRVGESWAEEEAVETSRASVERFLRLLFALAKGAALAPENLIEDFGPKTLDQVTRPSFTVQAATPGIWSAFISFWMKVSTVSLDVG